MGDTETFKFVLSLNGNGREKMDNTGVAPIFIPFHLKHITFSVNGAHKEPGIQPIVMFCFVLFCKKRIIWFLTLKNEENILCVTFYSSGP